MRTKLLLVALAIPALLNGALAQSNIFHLMQDPVKLADKYYERGDYEAAIVLYEDAVEANNSWPAKLKLARALYRTRNYSRSAALYETLADGSQKLPASDMLLAADALIILRNYDAAKEYLQKVLHDDPDNEIVSRKLWRLSNLSYIMEDSAHYRVRRMSFNTGAAEFNAVPFNDQVIFTSNRKGLRPIDLTNDEAGAELYKLYSIAVHGDTATGEITAKGSPSRYATSLRAPYHIGPLAFYDKGTKMVYVASSPKADANGFRHLGLYFASKTNGQWKQTGEFNYNSDQYSISDVTINEEGTTMYFSTTTKDGFGGKDIYRSVKSGLEWSRPRNAGDVINTPGDEVFPYLYRNGTMYFSSNGHSGMGGLDIFSAAILGDGFSEPENIGYPINSHQDDFSFVLDSTAVGGFLTSNRLNGGFDDDIYSFNMDLQVYPLLITGILHWKEHSWSDTADIKLWPNTKLTLVDTWRNKVITSTNSDENGAFSLTIPYFSRYHIVVTSSEGTEYPASLELEKFRTSNTYEIVVVKNMFAAPESR